MWGRYFIAEKGGCGCDVIGWGRSRAVLLLDVTDLRGFVRITIIIVDRHGRGDYNCYSA